ncbi:lactococcin 972 family bacteriocin [Shouchella sp. 1P09AA]|jgi:hypothetical protein|uniref:lactococcin 972 family bacteriocin n=1 Tax=Bacillaceae TaxID=186817 RepID=UPI0020CFFF74|nr:lactococcin 972 family bacteriocin [Alkalihalobacillus sp. LMS6]UTR06749.1 lactococcin 972 family bacteriocin [Alkalihalobacillus sp. LMS6]
MKKVIFLSFCSVVGASLFLASGDAKAHHDGSDQEQIMSAEFNYDTGEYIFSYEGENPIIGDGIGLQSHNPNAGGGTWYHGFNGIKDHFSRYDHKSWIHRASTSNSRHTDRGPWLGKNGGFSNSKIAQSATGNKAYWDISVDGNIPR